jgi:peroxiredoxin (alkyl hydroperoxide reductase subunit C)
VEGHLLLAEGLHLRLPDRDRRLRQARIPVRGARRRPLGGSTDNEFSKLGWRRDHKDLSKLGHWSFGDSKGSLVDQLGIRDKAEGVALRATFIVDPDNTIQHVSVNNLNVGRNPEEVLRILDGLQTDELCPCNRTVGGDTL